MGAYGSAHMSMHTSHVPGCRPPEWAPKPKHHCLGCSWSVEAEARPSDTETAEPSLSIDMYPLELGTQEWDHMSAPAQHCCTLHTHTSPYIGHNGHPGTLIEARNGVLRLTQGPQKPQYMLHINVRSTRSVLDHSESSHSPTAASTHHVWDMWSWQYLSSSHKCRLGVGKMGWRRVTYNKLN